MNPTKPHLLTFVPSADEKIDIIKGSGNSELVFCLVETESAYLQDKSN